MTIVAWIILALCVALLTVLPTGAFMMSLVCAAVLLSIGAALVVLLGRTPKPESPPRGTRLLAWLTTAALLLFLVTLLPLPLKLTALTGKTRHMQNQVAFEATEGVVGLEMVPPMSQRYALTRNQSGTARVALLAVAAIGAALLTGRLGPRGKLLYLRFLILVGAIVAALGYVSLKYHPQGDTLWWIFPVPHGLPGPVACFRNPNHFAAFLAMLCPLSLALFGHDVRKVRPLRAVLDLAAFGGMSLMIVHSLSRGALVAYAAGLVACALLYLWHRRWLAGGTMIIIGIIAVTAILSVRHPFIRQRLNSFLDLKSTDSYQTRVAIWKDSGSIFRHYAILGAGANGFRMVYPQHRTTTQGAQVTSHAENEYVQLAVDGGLAGLALVLAGLVAFGTTAVGPALRNRDGTVYAVAALGAAAVAATNAALDYPLHVPLYTIPLASIMGVILPPSLATAGDGTPRERVTAAAPVLCNLALAAILVLGWGKKLHFDSEWHMQHGDLQLLSRAVQLAPTSAFAWYYLGREVGRANSPEARLLSTQFLSRAGELDPNNYKLWFRIGRRKDKLGDTAGAAQAFGRVKALRDWHQVPYLPEARGE